MATNKTLKRKKRHYKKHTKRHYKKQSLNKRRYRRRIHNKEDQSWKNHYNYESNISGSNIIDRSSRNDISGNNDINNVSKPANIVNGLRDYLAAKNEKKKG